MRNDELLLNERVNNAVNAMLKHIRDEIEQMRAKPDNMVKLIGDFISIDYVLGVINKYMEDKK